MDTGEKQNKHQYYEEKQSGEGCIETGGTSTRDLCSGGYVEGKEICVPSPF